MYYSIFDYMAWYNWYYGITEEERVVVVERIETPIAELETQPPLAELETPPPVSKKKSTFRSYHLRK